jgi:pimeloyl-ACP methyl ester carboxylesterase
LIDGREAVYLRHLWDSFTGDKVAAPFSTWEPYVAAMTRTGVPSSGASYYRALYESAAQVRTLIERKLDIPVLAIAGEKGVGKNHETLVRAFATNVRNLIVPGAGHFLAEERPQQTLDALRAFLAE